MARRVETQAEVQQFANEITARVDSVLGDMSTIYSTKKELESANNAMKEQLQQVQELQTQLQQKMDGLQQQPGKGGDVHDDKEGPNTEETDGEKK